jgi:exodeoxyribonuclease V
MKLSNEQDKAIDAVRDWLKTGDAPFFYLAGYAGVGKTTLAKYMADEVVNGQVMYAAFSGKAASVMREKGCKDASTIHRLIYMPMFQRKDEIQRLRNEFKRTDLEDIRARKRIRAELEKLERPGFHLNIDSPLKHAALLILDECSMVNEEIAQDILSFDTPVLVLGDPGQLPPVEGAGYFTEREPDFMLTEIHRQARDNPIIKIATDIREGIMIPYGDWGAVRKIERMDIRPSWLADNGAGGQTMQVLTGMNRTRRNLNIKLRGLLGYGYDAYPRKGEKLICLKNDYQYGFMNGTLATVLDDINISTVHNCLVGNIEYDGERLEKVKIQSGHFDIYDNPDTLIERERDETEFDYAYAITSHKAQGSQWDRVVLMDDGFLNWKPIERQRWLYTSVTRASKELLIVA